MSPDASSLAHGRVYRSGTIRLAIRRRTAIDVKDRNRTRTRNTFLSYSASVAVVISVPSAAWTRQKQGADGVFRGKSWRIVQG